jgi:hypothetical protein
MGLHHRFVGFLARQFNIECEIDTFGLGNKAVFMYYNQLIAPNLI